MTVKVMIIMIIIIINSNLRNLSQGESFVEGEGEKDT